jgi:hypothetical protein
MSEAAEKKGRLKLTVEVEVNEELMDVVKDAVAQGRLPDMMKRNENKQ